MPRNEAQLDSSLGATANGVPDPKSTHADTNSISSATAAESTQTVHVLVIEHRHGVNVSAHRTHEGARNELSGFVQEWWESETQQSALEMPADIEVAIEAYFEIVTDEFWSITPTELHD